MFFYKCLFILSSNAGNSAQAQTLQLEPVSPAPTQAKGSCTRARDGQRVQGFRLRAGGSRYGAGLCGSHTRLPSASQGCCCHMNQTIDLQQ